MLNRNFILEMKVRNNFPFIRTENGAYVYVDPHQMPLYVSTEGRDFNSTPNSKAPEKTVELGNKSVDDNNTVENKHDAAGKKADNKKPFYRFL